MRHKLVNFTRGSQLIGHFGFMFAAGLKGPTLVALATFGGLIWWRLNATLTDQESYLSWMRLYVAAYSWFEFDPTKPVNLARDGHPLLIPIALAAKHPLMVSAWTKCMGAVRDGAMLAAFLTVPATMAFAWAAAWFGRRSKESRHERGATLATCPALIGEIEAHNRIERSREYGRLLGPSWRLASPAERRAANLYEPYTLAGVPFPWRLEQSHAMLIGTTGTGKTVALRDLLQQVRDRGHRAVIFDLTGAFIEAFYDPARDVILNPLDARCPQWSVFEDCRDEAAFTAAAEALVPHDGGGSEQFWVLAARMLFVEMCLKLVEEGRATNQALSTELMTASLAHVHRLMEGTVADPLTAPEAARMAESIRAVFNANAKALRMLPTTGPRFSVRDWVAGAGEAGSFLFVSARYVDMAVASRLLTVWMDTAMNTLMAGPRTSDLKLWFLFDELGALHRLPALEKGLQTARNYGGAIVVGVHAYAKLKETYGDNMAMTLAALARTKLVLATADRESATWCSDFIGHRQYREMEEGYSYGYNNARDSVSLTPRRQIEPLLLPDQLMNLPRLQGYLKFPDGFPAAPVQLRYVAFSNISEPFAPRVPEERRRPARPADEAGSARPSADTVTGASDQGPGPSGQRSKLAEGCAASDKEAPVRVDDNLSGEQRERAERPIDTPFGRGAARANRAASEPAERPVRAASGGDAPPTGTPERPGQDADARNQNGAARTDARHDGRPGSVNPAHGVKPLTRPENISLREMREGIAPSDPGSVDQPELDL
ncbi:type IV secretion system DNA-binding domain-containing protein [Sphingomonas solaris]|uniref:Conjugal transfer protein TraD n=1 Tax=Alterirhizorhabdus solaris TaxID=2529389 RepID=A0A558R0C8_9SPHN|nr:type IV secretion system DNA-binding domain-containing protein [Sphingomonas solaris]TVV72772.1 conjugal transfer protein TraD [Sphingomonas solaris]